MDAKEQTPVGEPSCLPVVEAIIHFTAFQKHFFSDSEKLAGWHSMLLGGVQQVELGF